MLNKPSSVYVVFPSPWETRLSSRAEQLLMQSRLHSLQTNDQMFRVLFSAFCDLVRGHWLWGRGHNSR